MKDLKLPEKIKNNIQGFVKQLQDIYQQDLVSVILYGSASSAEFVEGHSNLNILVVLKNADLENIKKSSTLIARFKSLSPLFLSEPYIRSSTDIFPIEFLDMQENYCLLYGKDVLKDINVEINNLRFQCEQELKAKLINLRQAYLRLNKNRVALRNMLSKSFSSILHILRNVLRLKGKRPPYLKQDILREVVLEFGLDAGLWGKILALKNKQIKLGNKDIENLFINFVRQLEKIVAIVDGP